MSEAELNHAKFYQKYIDFKKSYFDSAKCLLAKTHSCREDAINSHTISATSLRMISDKGNLIYPKIKPFTEKTQTTGAFERIGIKKASTFKGFCNTHDSEVFRPVDTKDLKITTENMALLFIRSLYQEQQKKDIAKKFLYQIADSEEPFIRDALKANADGQTVGADFMSRQLIELNHQIERKDCKDILYLCLTCDIQQPFAYACCYNFALENLERRYGPSVNISYIRGSFIGAIPTISGTTFIVAWHKGDSSEMKPFLERLSNATKAIPEFFFQFGIEKCENFFFDPRWYGSHSDIKKDYLLNIYQESTGYYLPVQNRYFESLFPDQKYRISARSNTLIGKQWIRKNRKAFYS